MSDDIDGARQLAQRLRTETADKQSWDYERWTALLQMAATHLDNACNVFATPAPQAVGDEPSNVELRGLWYGAGGSFHGPNVETGTMPEAKLPPPAAPEPSREVPEPGAAALFVLALAGLWAARRRKS